MAQALRIPVVGVPSLDLVAYPLRHTERTIVAVLDARRREVFAARYQPVPGGVQRVSDYAVHPPPELVAELAADAAESPTACCSRATASRASPTSSPRSTTPRWPAPSSRRRASPRWWRSPPRTPSARSSCSPASCVRSTSARATPRSRGANAPARRGL